jgi:hypothetical protein
MIRYLIEMKQRSGKWAPQCECDTREAAQESFVHMQHMKRKLRVVQLENGLRKVVATWEHADIEGWRIIPVEIVPVSGDSK